MMKNIYTKILLGLMLITSFSCSESFLEIDPEQQVATEDAITSVDDLESSIVGVYDIMSDNDYYGRYFVLIPDVMSDDVKQNSQANRIKNYAEYVVTTDDAQAEDLWVRGYEAINAANTVIHSDLELTGDDADTRDILVGTAYALRGLVFFDMVRLFGQHYTYTSDASHFGIPLPLESPEATAQMERSTVAEVYAQVISDMTTAISLMDDSTLSGTTSTLSANAVKALLSRVYLYMEDWSNAEAMATEVIDSGDYTLLTNAAYADSFALDANGETIFEFVYTDSDHFGSESVAGLYLSNYYGDYLPSADVLDLIPDGDARNDLYIVDDGLTGDYAPFRVNKYPIAATSTKVIRLSEIYLIRAEARAELGDDSGAQDDVNTIKTRGLPSATLITSTGDELKEAIATERRIELAFEGQRIWDLTRNKEGVERTQCTSSVCTVSYPNDYFVLPIPQAELDVNTEITPNPGY